MTTRYGLCNPPPHRQHLRAAGRILVALAEGPQTLEEVTRALKGLIQTRNRSHSEAVAASWAALEWRGMIEPIGTDGKYRRTDR